MKGTRLAMSLVLVGGAEGFALRDLVAAGEVEEGLFGFTVLGVGRKEALHLCRKFGEADGGDEFAGEAPVLVCAAADEDLIALFAADLDAHEAEVADVVLGAGVVAAGDVEG